MGSAGREAAELAAAAGLILDPWQELVLEHALAIQPNGKWCAADVGVMVSRQNGKGSILEALELWALFVNEETILHTAHNYKTALEGFRRIESLIRANPQFLSEVLRISHNNNDQVIELRNGARLMFGTRTKGAARGLTLDRVICDEAMYLAEEHVTALAPTTMAVPNAQMWYLGSAGDKQSTEFGRMRARALKGNDPSLMYAEWSIDAHTSFCPPECDEHDDPYSEASWAKANPSLGDRIAIDYMGSRSRAMSVEAFSQEHLGVGDWPIEGDAWRVIDQESWQGRTDEASQPGTPLVFAIDVTPDRQYGCIAVAGSNGEGMTHIEITGDGMRLDHRSGTRWLVPRVHELYKKWRPAYVVVDKGSQAGHYVDELEALGVKVLSPTMREYAQGCGAFHSACVPRRGESPSLVHTDQAPLTTAVAGAERRDLADLWAWDKRNATVDISPLVAGTLAYWGHAKAVAKPKARPRAAWG